MNILKKDMVCRLGDNNHQEDVAFLVVQNSLVRGGTGDGATVPHNDEHPLELYNGKTGAELASLIYKRIFEDASPTEPLKRILGRANDSIRLLHQVLLDLDGTEPGSKLHGLCFGVFEVRPMWTKIIWAGDAQVFIRFKDGRIWMTGNEIREHDGEMYSLVALYTEKAASELELDPKTTDEKEQNRIRARMWKHFYEPLCRARDERVNTDHPKGYSLMNGHPEALSLWQMRKFYTPHIEIVGSVTDGLMQPRNEFVQLSEEEAASRLLGYIEHFGDFRSYADYLEGYERHLKSLRHVRHMEKAGVLVHLA